MPKRKTLIKYNWIIEDLKAERIRRGWSIDYVAKLAGIHHSSLSEYERAQHVPPIDKVMVWATALGYQLDLLRR